MNDPSYFFEEFTWDKASADEKCEALLFMIVKLSEAVWLLSELQPSLTDSSDPGVVQ